MGLFPQHVHGAGDEHCAALDIGPAQAHQFTRAQAREHLKAVGMDKIIMHPLAPVQGSVHAEQRYQGIRLQHLLTFGTCASWHMQPFGVEGGQLLCTAPFAECPHIRAEGLQGLLCKAVTVGIVYHVLQVLLCQAGNTLPADRRQYPGAPAAFNVPLVAGARGLYHCGIPLLIQILHPAGLDPDAII